MKHVDAQPDAHDIYRSLYEHAKIGESHTLLVDLVLRLFFEVEALRAAIADPSCPEGVRRRYRAAYEAAAVERHCSVGLTNGDAELLKHFFPGSGGTFQPYLAMLERLGATPEQLAAIRARLDKVSSYT
ncbi:hypothetical protein [Nannocystis radixulma]|uniref:Uncharacterized protein n=1 Tax=Nannocystis radixulma TaxID=2995305 RepID=A0ABT5BD57_9BACT|nr:hypothetical protein [Nannocystis radixulma]MDC0672061.1 hypothetical protein [Nannocystis radixulma]